MLLVFGGSQGARALNELTLESFGEVGPAVLHLSGERDYDSLARRVTRDDYRLSRSPTRSARPTRAADLVLARSGGSVWELAAAGLPAVLVPYPFATADHQTKNARYFERPAAPSSCPETELGSAPALVRSLLDDPDRLARMRRGDARGRAARRRRRRSRRSSLRLAAA